MAGRGRGGPSARSRAGGAVASSVGRGGKHSRTSNASSVGKKTAGTARRAGGVRRRGRAPQDEDSDELDAVGGQAEEDESEDEGIDDDDGEGEQEQGIGEAGDGEAEDGEDDEKEEKKSIPPQLLTRLLHEFFDRDGTRMTRAANEAAAKYVDVFVREAIARSAAERSNSRFMEVEDLEKVAPQLLLDL